MNLTYFKRYRMEIDLPGREFSPSTPPEGYRFVPWEESLLDAYAEATPRPSTAASGMRSTQTSSRAWATWPGAGG